MSIGHQQLRVHLQQFEGPLDLLLYLIRKEEMNILDINIVEITRSYLEYIKLMKEFDLEVAGEFVAMAATLIHIKSKMLLPQYDENGEIVEQEDPRKELVQKLLEYEKFKEAAKALYERPLLNRDLWSRGVREKLEVKDDEIELEDNALFSLIGHYRRVMKALNKRVHKVNVKLQSIASRILQMRDRLMVGVQVTMRELFDAAITEPKEKMRNGLITFLSLLELGKMGYVSLYQTENYGDIFVNTKKPIEGDVVSKVEEYDNINANDVLQKMEAEALTDSEFDEMATGGALTDRQSTDSSENLSLFDAASRVDAASEVDGENTVGDEFVLAGMETIDGELEDSIETSGLLGEEIATDEEILQAELEMSENQNGNSEIENV